jgi:predicted AAA+ superfamily ATPase
MMVREFEARLRHLAGKFPVVTVTGPRQSGKTTLCRAVFPDKPYVSLEAPDVQEFARRDPRHFLAERRDGAVLDEVHRVPELLSYLQPLVDERPGAGRFVLTGSANFALLRSIGQSLGGRTALLELLPLSLVEVRRFAAPPTDLLDLLWRGSAPALYDRDLTPDEWYPSYVARCAHCSTSAISPLSRPSCLCAPAAPVSSSTIQPSVPMPIAGIEALVGGKAHIRRLRPSAIRPDETSGGPYAAQ